MIIVTDVYNAEKIKNDIKTHLDNATWTIRPQTISLERDTKMHTENWLSQSGSSVHIRESNDNYDHFLGLTGGINIVMLSIEVFATTSSLLKSIMNDIANILRKPNLGDTRYVDIILRGTQQDSVQYRNMYRAIMDFQIRYHFTYE